jgi:hypothetical protein
VPLGRIWLYYLAFILTNPGCMYGISVSVIDRAVVPLLSFDPSFRGFAGLDWKPSVAPFAKPVRSFLCQMYRPARRQLDIMVGTNRICEAIGARWGAYAKANVVSPDQFFVIHNLFLAFWIHSNGSAEFGVLE